MFKWWSCIFLEKIIKTNKICNPIELLRPVPSASVEFTDHNPRFLFAVEQMLCGNRIPPAAAVCNSATLNRRVIRWREQV